MRGIVASEMLDRATLHTLSVKVTSAIAFRANVLIHTAVSVCTVEFLNDLRRAKLGQVTIHTASSRLRISVERITNLFCRKLTVGILRKKIADPLPPRRPIRFLLHLIPQI